MTAPWIASAGCPAHIRPALERWVNGQASLWRQPPSSDEVFDSFEHCFQRLQLFAVTQGFAIVIRGSGTPQTPAKRFRCIHHSDETQNNRKLVDDVEKDSEGQIISNRKRGATHTKQKSCKWYTYCSFKDIGKRGSGIKGYCLAAPELAHSHRLVDNPLMYEINQQLIPEYQQLVASAVNH
jgi:hypothetical protein